jgi:hypothetical protein
MTITHTTRLHFRGTTRSALFILTGLCFAADKILTPKACLDFGLQKNVVGDFLTYATSEHFTEYKWK